MPTFPTGPMGAPMGAQPRRPKNPLRDKMVPPIPGGGPMPGNPGGFATGGLYGKDPTGGQPIGGAPDITGAMKDANPKAYGGGQSMPGMFDDKKMGGPTNLFPGSMPGGPSSFPAPPPGLDMNAHLGAGAPPLGGGTTPMYKPGFMGGRSPAAATTNMPIRPGGGVGQPGGLTTAAPGARIPAAGIPAANPRASSDQAWRDAWQNGGWQREQADYNARHDWRTANPIQRTPYDFNPSAPGDADYYPNAALYAYMNPSRSGDTGGELENFNRYWTMGPDGQPVRNNQPALRPDGSIDYYGSTGRTDLEEAQRRNNQPVAAAPPDQGGGRTMRSTLPGQGGAAAPQGQGGNSTPEERANIWNVQGGQTPQGQGRTMRSTLSGQNQGQLYDQGTILNEIANSPYGGELMQLIMQLFGGSLIA